MTLKQIGHAEFGGLQAMICDGGTNLLKPAEQIYEIYIWPAHGIGWKGKQPRLVLSGRAGKSKEIDQWLSIMVASPGEVELSPRPEAAQTPDDQWLAQ